VLVPLSHTRVYISLCNASATHQLHVQPAGCMYHVKYFNMNYFHVNMGASPLTRGDMCRLPQCRTKVKITSHLQDIGVGTLYAKYVHVAVLWGLLTLTFG